jgi:hypothetical protein
MQALFGDSNYFSDKTSNIRLEPDGLFHYESWKIISACFLCKINKKGSVIFPFYWKNPLAIKSLPDSLMNTFGAKACENLGAEGGSLK